MQSIKHLPTLAAALLLGACATPGASECRAADWRLIGFEDGARGRAPGYVARHREACAEHGVTPHLDRYREGHVSGLAQFCTAGNGFALGRGGEAYGGVCPRELDARFVAAYRTGRRLHQLQTSIAGMRQNAGVKQSELESLEPRSRNLERLLVAGGISLKERELLRREFDLLQSNITRLRTQARVLELEAAKLQAEYDRLDASHPYR